MARKIPAHGEPQRYRHGPDENDEPGKGCHCTLCTAGATRDMKRRRLDGPCTVDAEAVRRHVLSLKNGGLSYKSIAAIAHVQDMVLCRLLYGDKARGLPPTRRMRRGNAQALLAVRPGQVGKEGFVSAAGTRRRLQALARAGWPAWSLGRETGLSAEYVGKLTRGQCGQAVIAATARAVVGAYDRLWSVDPASAGVAPGKASQVSTMAARRGWLLPAAWDDDLIDLPDQALEASLRQQAESMDDHELRLCAASRRMGDQSPLTVAASREYDRRRARKQAAA